MAGSAAGSATLVSSTHAALLRYWDELAGMPDVVDTRNGAYAVHCATVRCLDLVAGPWADAAVAMRLMDVLRGHGWREDYGFCSEPAAIHVVSLRDCIVRLCRVYP